MPHVPAVSVLVPCYNDGAFLAEAVDSALAQTLADIEIVVVDDGSNDPATRKILESFHRPKTRVIHVPHGGLAAARNRGLAETTGRYVCALDADDRLDPRFLEKTVAVLDRDPSAAFVSAWLRAFGDETFEWKPERCDLATLLTENTVLTAALVRREALEAVGGYDGAMPAQGDEDWDLWLTLVERGGRGVIVPEVLFHYRRRAGSMSRDCWHGPGHMPLARYRLGKHREAYRDHLFEVLLRQEAETAALLRRNDELERQIASDLEPAVARRRAELESLRAKLAPPRTSRERDLEAALQAAATEVAALRDSASWRVTAPLRDVYGWWLRLRGTP
jgi:glycosyltransferase involved in cell wall biosynthesis